MKPERLWRNIVAGRHPAAPFNLQAVQRLKTLRLAGGKGFFNTIGQEPTSDGTGEPISAANRAFKKFGAYDTADDLQIKAPAARRRSRRPG